MLALSASWHAAGQEAAGIIGQVTDSSGGGLPGVPHPPPSPPLQLHQVTGVTDAHGEYRLTPLPIGTYSIDYALSGFRTIRRAEVRLTVGFVAKIDAVMEVGELEET